MKSRKRISTDYVATHSRELLDVFETHGKRGDESDFRELLRKHPHERIEALILWALIHSRVPPESWLSPGDRDWVPPGETDWWVKLDGSASFRQHFDTIAEQRDRHEVARKEHQKSHYDPIAVDSLPPLVSESDLEEVASSLARAFNREMGVAGVWDYQADVEDFRDLLHHHAELEIHTLFTWLLDTKGRKEFRKWRKQVLREGSKGFRDAFQSIARGYNDWLKKPVRHDKPGPDSVRMTDADPGQTTPPAPVISGAAPDSLTDGCAESNPSDPISVPGSDSNQAAIALARSFNSEMAVACVWNYRGADVQDFHDLLHHYSKEYIESVFRWVLNWKRCRACWKWREQVIREGSKGLRDAFEGIARDYDDWHKDWIRTIDWDDIVP